MPRLLAYKTENALNAICPYFTMFPLEYPLGILRKYKGRETVVMDPFCGRGTTLFAARQLGLVSRGVDTSPIAVAVARAKLATVDVDRVLGLARLYIGQYSDVTLPRDSFFRAAFHPGVLRSLCAVRYALLKVQRDTDATVILRAAMLGCLHGPRSKTAEGAAYFSNQMPRTFAPKPDYSVRYWKAKGLKARNVDVCSVLERKLRRIALSHPISPGVLTDARLGDSRLLSSMPKPLRNFSVVVTSPPYYGMRTYVEDQWLRNWFLGGEAHVVYGDRPQLNHAGEDSFSRSLGRVWRNMAESTANELDMYIRFGVIPSLAVDARALLRRSLKYSGVDWKVVSVRGAKSAASGKRQAVHMAATSAALVEYDFHVKRN